MKKSLIGLLVIGLVVLLAGPASAVTVWLQPASQTVANNAVATVEVLISGVTAPGIDTLNFVMSFDASLVTITGAAVVGDVGPWDNWMDIGEGFWSQGPELDNVNGETSFTQWNSGTGGAAGAGTIAILTFVADASNTGTAGLNFTSWLIQQDDTPVSHVDTAGEIVIGGEGPVIPEPATMMLVAAGLAALGGYAKKKRS